MSLGRVALELDVPALHVGLGHARGTENLHPSVLVEMAGRGQSVTMAQQSENQPLLVTQSADLLVERSQTGLQQAGQFASIG